MCGKGEQSLIETRSSNSYESAYRILATARLESKSSVDVELG